MESFKLSNNFCQEKYINNRVIVLENIEGTMLSSLLFQDKLNFEEWLAIFCQILLALEIGSTKI